MGLDDIRKLIGQLAALPNRGAGTEGEAQAAKIVQTEFQTLGLETTTQTFKAPKILGHAVALFLGLAWTGVMIGYGMPVLGTGLVCISWFMSKRMFNLGGDEWIRLVPCGDSTNVIGKRITPGAKRTFVFSAHIDAGQTGLMFYPAVKRLFARLQGNPKAVQGPMYMPGMVILFSGILLAARALGAQGAIVSWLHHGVAIFLAASLLVTLQFMLSPFVPGAIDNASGVAAMVQAARDLIETPLADSDLYFVATGAEETGMIGMKHFYKTHMAVFDAKPVCFFNFESVGGGTLMAVEEEGELGRFKYPAFLIGLAQWVAKKNGFGDLPAVNLLAGTDAVVTANAGRPTLCLIALDELGVPPNYHEMADTADRVNFQVTKKAADLAVAVCREIQADGF